ncbi:MAG TPA: LacI family DNA-binding transcriptional regulator [Rhodanobacter sp.]|jgi:LacI family transcriptional regulator|nr:LacI family DNA-binding transcriptional regulator [Rhodanobacter sp.]
MPSHTLIGRKVTLNDVAAGCGVSRATVSLVLRGSPMVNKNTRSRVEEELRRQGYVYNRAAANLRQPTSSSIALILNDVANPFFAEFALTGFDDIGEAAPGMPSLTTLTTAPRERGQQAAQLLSQRLQQPQADSRKTIASVQLMVRENSCPPIAA